MKIDKNNVNSFVESNQVAPKGLNSNQNLAFALRDFLGSTNANMQKNFNAIESLPFIDEAVDTSGSDGEQIQEEVLNNAACRLRRWRAASRKLRRPRIIDNLNKSEQKAGSSRNEVDGGHTDLADRLRSLAVVGNMSSSAGELLAPPAATGPPLPGCLLSPNLASQSSVDYFGSSPECLIDFTLVEGFDQILPMPPPGPRYSLVTGGTLKVCCFQHTRTVVDKILASKFLRRWESHMLYLQEFHIVSRNPSGLLERPLSYSSMHEVYCISRWDAARKYCLRIVMSHGSLLLQANDAYTRDQWYHSIVWKRNIIRYRNFLTKSLLKEVILKELKNMVDFVLTTPLQNEGVTNAPLEIITELLKETNDGKKYGVNWVDWADSVTNVVGPLLAERGVSVELAYLLSRVCKYKPRSAALSALAPLVRRTITRNVDFGKKPNSRRLVKYYIWALSLNNWGKTLLRRFVEIVHGSRTICPHPRAGPNLASVSLSALDEYYKKCSVPHECSEVEEKMWCFAEIIEHMCEYEDWLLIVGPVMQPMPLCSTALACPGLAPQLGRILSTLARDPRCAAHTCLLPSLTLRKSPPSWIRASGPASALLCLPQDQLCELWGCMLDTVMNCCGKKKSFLDCMRKRLADLILVALREHPAALGVLTLMLEWEVANDDETQLEIISTLQGTTLGRQYYNELCERQQHLQRLQSEGGPSQLALPVNATDADVAALLEEGALGNLECLSLAFTNVTSECAHHLIKLPSLRYLNLWATKFGDRGLQLIAEHLTRLQVLNLCETPVSDRGIETISGLTNLRQLNLNSTKLSAETFKNLKKALPKLQHYDVRYTEAW